MPTAVTLIRSSALSDVAEYAYAATAPADARLVASTKQADLVTAWNVVRDAFGDHDAPSTLLGVTVLGYDDQLVEIEAVAAVRD